jgi:putative peptide zinc metalloprotease protein
MFAIAPDVTITEFDVAPSGRYLLRTPRGRFMVSRRAVDLIRRLDSGASVDDIARTPDERASIGRFLEEHVLPTGVFDTGDDVAPAKEPGRPPVAYVHSARVLVPAAALARATEIFRHLFRRSIAVPLLLLSAVAEALFWHANWGLRLEHISAGDYTLAGIAILLTLPFHELGHGSACRYYDCRHGSMGFAMYLIFPCFYTDVSDAWRLRRGPRVVIDLAGIYFQILCCGLFAALGLRTGHHVWGAALLMSHWSIVNSLKPYLRSDGYWVLVDIVGVPSPYRRVKEYLAHRFSRGDESAATPLLLQIAPRLRRFTLAYIAVTTVLATWMVATVSWTTLTIVLPGYPAVVADLLRLPFGTLAWWSNAGIGVGQTVLIASLALALWSWGGAGAQQLRRRT